MFYILCIIPNTIYATESEKQDSIKYIKTGDGVTVKTKHTIQQGFVNSFEQLLAGKIAGVQVIGNSGSPTSGNTILIRGGGSTFGDNKPLIILDGMPLDTKSICGNLYNFNSLINPNDVESISILRDAAETSIYGPSASNGVILITTRKPENGKLKINFVTTNAIQTPTAASQILTSNQFRDLINNQGTTLQKNLLGLQSTDWNKTIFQTAPATDNYLSVSGEPIKNIPFTASVGYLNQDGTLKTDNTNRLTTNLNIRPSFFNNYLQLGIQVMGSVNNNRFANTNAIYHAQRFNPTYAVFSDQSIYGGFTEYPVLEGSVPSNIINPLGILNQNKYTSQVNRLITNFSIQYRLHFFPDLSIKLQSGSDQANGKGLNTLSANSIWRANRATDDIETYYQNSSRNYFNASLEYKKRITGLNCDIDALIGYESISSKDSIHYESIYQIKNENPNTNTTMFWSEAPPEVGSYGKVLFNFDSHYWLTASIRHQANPMFSTENRWVLLPSYSIGWNLLGNKALRSEKAISYLKVIANYGVTADDVLYNTAYNQLATTNFKQYAFNKINGYNPDLNWATTKMYNIELNFGFLGNVIDGTIDFYTSRTNNLLNVIQTINYGQGNSSYAANVGTSQKQGLELSLRARPLMTANVEWTVNMNFDCRKSKLVDFGNTGLTSLFQYDQWNTPFKITSTGYEPGMFYVYQQIYDNKGKPIEGLYVDQNTDGKIDVNDRIRYHSANPQLLLNFGTDFNYKKWTAGCQFRASFGNYVYNMTNAYYANWSSVTAYGFNIPTNYLYTGFQKNQESSSYYVENASFLKMDNIYVSYDFGKVMKDINCRLTVGVQNVITLSSYSGSDPEVLGGVDYGFYSRPRIFSIKLNLDI